MDHLGIPDTYVIPKPRLYCQTPNISRNKLQKLFFAVIGGTANWRVDDDKLVSKSKLTSGSIEAARNSFVQEWLFFGLISVVFTDLQLDLTRFLYSCEGDAVRITTKPLIELIRQWHERERNEPKGRYLRLCRVQRILEYARSFARNLSVHGSELNVSWPVGDDLAFSILVLGQTLSHAWHEITMELKVTADSQTRADVYDEGWGSSRLVLNKLKQQRWPLPAIKVLQRFWKNNTIGLLLTLTFSRWEEYSNNVPNSCHFPHSECSGCLPLGANCKVEVCNALEEGFIPLFKYDPLSQVLEVVLMDKTFNKSYAIFSHVWSNGFGSPSSNELPHCQLKHFHSLFVDVQEENTAIFRSKPREVPELFWIDTLGIPVETDDNARRLRGKAIAQMHDIYKHARYTIVLDKSLMRHDIDLQDYTRMATLISMSGWARRLWTLQESVLSKDLYFNFSDGLFHINKLEDRYRSVREQKHTSTHKLARMYHSLILEDERLRLGKDQKCQHDETSRLVCSLWSAIRWREQAQKQHETLALSIILDLDTEDLLKAHDLGYTGRLEELMKTFLNLLSKSPGNAIPASLIFLPKPHLKAKGYGWAPESCLLAEGTVYTETLIEKYPRTRLIGEHGLEVQMPGFRLDEFEYHCDRLQNRESFTFPVDAPNSGVGCEWYRVERADSDTWPKRTDFRNGQAAIICSHSHTSRDKQIGLLVSVMKHSVQDVITAYILSRVLISQEVDTKTVIKLDQDLMNLGDLYFCFGRCLPSTQLWQVDRFQPINAQQEVINVDEAYRLTAADGDSCATYSFSSSLEAKRLNANGQLILVNKLVKVLRSSSIRKEFPRDVTLILSDLFGSFAAKLGHEAREKTEVDTMLYIAKYKSEIAHALQVEWKNQERIMPHLDTVEIDTGERTGLWSAHQGEELTMNFDFQKQDFPFNHYESNHEGDDELNVNQTNPSVNIDSVTRTSAFAWLSRKLINLLRLSVPISDTMASIHQKIKNCYPSTKIISRQTAQLKHTMSVNLNWPLIDFLENYHYDGARSTADILKTYITLTSDGVHTQALTATQYLHQNWPESGGQILDLIIRLVQTHKASLVIADATITADIIASRPCFQITGLVNSICEISEQLIWMGAVFRSSPVRNVTYESKPSILNIERKISESLPFVTMSQESQHFSCDISYSMVPNKGESMSDGCWHGMFRYAVVAQGFPIAQRADSIQGLEMSLGMILALCHAQHIGRFNDHIIIKGFSSLCSLAERQSGTSIWHFMGDVEGQYFSCSDASLNGQHQSLTIHEITKDRHFVGWSSNATYGIGALDSNYRVKPAKLPSPYAGCLLHSKSLRRGQRHPTETICIADSKDNPRCTAKKSFHERLKRMHIRPIVLWDADGQRGWLTNGTSALLHLVLMSVENDGSPFNSAYCLRKAEIKQQKPHVESAAAHILLDARNWKLPILDDGEHTFVFRDRIEDLYFLLDLAIEYQIMATANSKVISSILEGWNFMDMADMAHDPIKPKVYSLDKDCCGWMNFLQDTNAVTLFGNDFGELFKPKDLDACSYWKTLPQQNCYLAANINDLNSFSQAYNDNSISFPWKLTENTVWPVLNRTSQQCICSGSSSEHSNFVQVLLPQSAFMTKPYVQNIVDPIPKNEFVIFGEARNSIWVRSDHCFSVPLHLLGSEKHSNEIELYDSITVEAASSVVVANSLRSLPPTEYRVAIVCALPEELKAVRCLFDEELIDPAFDKNDGNSYVFGRLEVHNIVAACLPGIYGTASAAHLITKLTCSFQKIEFCLLVGIGGGIPSQKNDVRLGDVVISCPRGARPGAIKHDFLRIVGNGESELLGHLREPPDRLLSAITKIRSDPNEQMHELQPYLDKIGKDHPEYRYPGSDMDTLYAPSCSSIGTEKMVIQRNIRQSTQPHVHYGLIATGDSVIKDAETRDRFGLEHGALCFEMEAAGILNVVPSLIIRGICDYSDSHKNDNWHEYASATAAAYAKFLLARVRA